MPYHEVDRDLLKVWWVAMLPYSREVARLMWLKKSVAVYRLAFGQPRQDDFLEYLSSLADRVSDTDFEALQINLAPSG